MALRGVDLVLFVLLPELVDPPQRVVGRKDLIGKIGEDLFQRVPVLRREPQTRTWVAEAEDPWQNLGCEPCRDRPAVKFA